MTEPVGQSPEERDWEWGDDPAILAAATVRPPGDEAGLRAAALANAFQEMDAAMRIKHRLEPRCSALMPTDGRCDCGLAEARVLAAALAAKSDQEEDAATYPGRWLNHAETLAAEYARLANPDTGS